MRDFIDKSPWLTEEVHIFLKRLSSDWASLLVA